MNKLYWTSASALCWLLVSCGPGAGGGKLPDYATVSKVGMAVYDVATGTTRADAIAATPNRVFVAAMASGQKALFQEIRTATGTTRKPIQFNPRYGYTPPGANPGSLEIAGESYLLFARSDNTREFLLYKQTSEGAESIIYTQSSLWDFSAISNYLKAINYKGQLTGRAFCPCWSASRQTLYFTIVKQIEDQIKGNPVIMSVFQSKLVGTAFQTPTATLGEIDLYDASHYLDGLPHSSHDFPGITGMSWVGRLYLTQDGKHAYFNSLSNQILQDYGIMKPNDPWIAPIPNKANFGGLNITDFKDPRVIWTAVYQADIDDNGRFINLAVLPPSVNQGGVNFVSDISPDGKTLMVSHMEMDAQFWAFNWGPDGLAAGVCGDGAETMAPWDGFVIEYQYDGTDWIKVNTIGETF